MILDVSMIVLHLILYIVYLVLFLWIINRWKFFQAEGVSRIQLSGFFLLKVIAGIGLTLVYTYYYTDHSKADIYRYFNDSKIISQVLFQDVRCWLKIMSGIGTYDPDAFSFLVHTQYFSHSSADAATDNTLIIRLNVLLNYLSFSNIYINTLFFNFLCFLGLTGLFKTLSLHFGANLLLLCFPIYLFPSVIFWSSGLLKESLLFFFIGLGVYLITNSTKILPKIGAGVLFVLIIFVKPAVFFSLMTAMGVYLTIKLFVTHKEIVAKGRLKAFVFCVWFAIVCLLLSKSSIVCSQLIDKRNEFVQLAINENAGSLLDTQILSADCNNVLALFPSALIKAILRPFPWESGGVFQRIFALENTAVFLLILYLLVRYFKTPERNQLITAVSLLVFALINYVIIGITVPVLGAIVHYRVIATPFLIIALLSFVKLEKYISDK